MPTYEYVCDGCGHSFEQFQSIKENALEICPACQQKQLRRLFGCGAAVLFKGSGFYETDYRSESYRKAASSDKPPSPEKTSGSDSSSGGSAKSSGEGGSAGKPAD